MRLPSFFSLLGSLIFTSAPVSVSCVPVGPSAIEARDDYTWQQCTVTAPGMCTVYMATSDPDIDDYRTAVLFDNNCNVLQAIMDSKNNPKLTLKGSLNNYVDLFVDPNIHPGGWISYLSADTPLGETMTCYKPPNSDGVGCRKAFGCNP